MMMAMAPSSPPIRSTERGTPIVRRCPLNASLGALDPAAPCRLGGDDSTISRFSFGNAARSPAGLLRSRRLRRLSGRWSGATVRCGRQALVALQTGYVRGQGLDPRVGMHIQPRREPPIVHHMDPVG